MRAALLLSAAGVFLSPSAVAEPASYTIDASHTHVQFSVMRFGFNQIIGEFQELSGEIVLDEDAPESSSVRVTIDTTSLESGDPLRNEHVSGPAWLDTNSHPTMSFASTNVEQTSEMTALITGDLTIKGITQPVVLNATLNRIGTDPVSRGQAAGFSATAQISRAAFGIDVAGNLIGDEVSIRIEALALTGG